MGLLSPVQHKNGHSPDKSIKLRDKVLVLLPMTINKPQFTAGPIPCHEKAFVQQMTDSESLVKKYFVAQQLESASDINFVFFGCYSIG